MRSDQRHGAQPENLTPPQIAACNRVLFENCLEKAKVSSLGSRFDEMLEWAGVAGWFASRKGWFGRLSSAQLENELLRAAASLAVPPRKPRSAAKARWLHVVTEAYGTLGHTNLCRRWIEYDSTVTHDVILLDQKDVVPANLASAVRNSGGVSVALDAMTTFMERARALREYAWANPDVVVLHTHPEDVIATVAFGVKGGPPVILVNHADHIFWVGCSVADLVLDIRTSGHLWTKAGRGVDRAVVLPLPLPDREPGLEEGPTRGELRRKIRAQLGIPQEAVVFLTIGSAAKYDPMNGLDFIQTAKEILSECKDAWLIAVGPPDEGSWNAAKKSTGGRVIAVGRQPSTGPFCAAADIYLEGFPAGSLTACLEAALAGLALVRDPGNCPPPFASDGVGLDEVRQPADLHEYTREAVRLAKNPQARNRLRQDLQGAIQSNYCRDGWLGRLQKIKEQIPTEHKLYPDFKSTPVDELRRDWLVAYNHAKDPEVSLTSITESLFIEAWKRTEGEPQVDAALWGKLMSCLTDGLTNDTSARDLDASSLAALNRRIKRRGGRARLISGARLAHLSGKHGVARRMIYSCLRENTWSLFDLEWIRLLLKTHLSPKWISNLKRWMPLHV